MNEKFMDLLNRLFNRIEKDSEKNEKDIDDLRKSQHKSDLVINQLVKLPKKTSNERFEKIEAKTEEIEKSLPNAREVKASDKEKEEVKDEVKKNSRTLLKIVMYISATVTSVVILLGILKQLGII